MNSCIMNNPRNYLIDEQERKVKEIVNYVTPPTEDDWFILLDHYNKASGKEKIIIEKAIDDLFGINLKKNF